MTLPLTRRNVLLGAAANAMLAACASTAPPPLGPTPPIVFVHGDGDTAGLWITTLWRFESNGWPRERLHAVDIPYPVAHLDQSKPLPGRSSSVDCMLYLASEVDKVLKATGASQVVLIANSRGGYAVRNYIANGRGAAKVSHAILCGTPNHGVWADLQRAPGSEYNGAGPMLTELNAPKGAAGDEVTPGVKWMTIRSDNNDKYAQPDGFVIGAKGTPTHVTFEGPALKGAENVVIAGIDHRETAFSPMAFEQMFRFVVGRPPATTKITPENQIVLDGKISGYGDENLRGISPSNLPMAGAMVEVYATNSATGERLGGVAHRKFIGDDGAWGPFKANPLATYEIVISASGYANTHVYRSPFARSCNIVNLRAERIPDADKDALALVTLSRPRGFFGVPRDSISLDGKSPPDGLPTGVAIVSVAKLKINDSAQRTVVGEFNGERIAGRAWPAVGNEVTILELLY
jgi:triacylglycerol lipase